MKSFLIFLSGVLIVAAGAGAAMFFLLGQPAKGPAVSVDAKNAEILSPEDRFVISGTIEVPDALKSVIQNGKGRLTITLQSGPGVAHVRSLAPAVMAPAFPYRFSFTLSKNELSANPKIKAGLALYVSYAPNGTEKQTGRRDAHFEPTAAAFRFLPFSEQQILGRTLPEKYDVGTIKFYRYFAQTVDTPCLSEAVLLAGKIVPTQAFLKEHAHDRFALVVYEDSTNGNIGGEAQPEEHIVHTQFLDFSSGASAFTVVKQKNRFPFYVLIGVKCEPGDALPTCVRRAFPIEPMREQNKHRYAIFGSHFEAPFCGMTDYVGTIDGPNYLSSAFNRVPEASAGEKNQ